ncbi:MAG: ATP12 family protein [Jannaschia sp.]
MTEWKAKRFWKVAQVIEEGDGFGVVLDTRPLRSPLKTAISMPTRPLAEGVAAEWDAQGDIINPLSMPLTRAVNATLDRVMPQQPDVAANLLDYGGSDLLCYRAARPDTLVALQDAAWNPLLDWLAETHGARLAVTQGVIPVPQPANAVEMLRARVSSMTAWELTALSEFVTLSGSLVIALAVMDGHIDPATGWSTSRVDENWQISQWGEDETEAELIARKEAAFHQAFTYLMLLRAG